MTDPYGIIDLASLRKDASATGTSAAGEAGRFEQAVTEQDLEQIIAGSDHVATLMVVTSSRVPQGPEFLATLRRLVDAREGALLLATVDADTQARVAGALRVQSLPTVLLLVRGQIQPMFEGVVSEAELGPVLDQVVELARSQGLQGAGTTEDGAEAEEEAISPEQQAAVDAIDRGDLDGAITAYETMLRADPSDAEARVGLAATRLMQRTQDADLQAARTAAAEGPDDLDAQLLVADLDILGGHVEDGFARLLEQLRGADAETKERVRERLLELFDVVGAEDPRVGPARRRMASLLF